MHLTYFATPLELRSENVSKINENFNFHGKYMVQLYSKSNSFVLVYFVAFATIGPINLAACGEFKIFIK